MQALLSWMKAVGLGEPEQLLPLEGTVPLPDGTQAAAALALGPAELWLAGAITAERGAAWPLGRNPTLRWEGRLLGARLHADGRSYGVARGAVEATRALLALGRLRARARDGVALPPLEPPCFDRPDARLEALLRAWLRPGELPLAVLPTAEALPVEDPAEPTEEHPARLVLTDRRCALLAVGGLGGLAEEALPTPLHLRPGRRAVAVLAGARRLGLPRGSAQVLALLAPATAAEGTERVRTLALALRPAHPQLATALLARLPAPTPLDPLLLALWQDRDPLPALGELVLSPTDPEAAAAALEGASLAPERLLALVAVGVDAEPAWAPWLLPLHRRAWAALRAREERAGAMTEGDLHLAQHLLLAGRPADAEALLLGALQRLPEAQLVDLLPPADADPVAGEGGHTLRVQLLEALAIARGTEGHPDPDTLAALARLQPLVQARVALLQDQGPPALRPRAAELLAVMQDLRPGPERPTTRPRTLPEPLLQECVQHPAARPGGALDWLQGWLAQAPAQARAGAREHAERLGRRHEAAREALADAVLLLGLPAVEGFVAHGTLARGLRALEGPPAALLIGAEHLDPEGPLWLRPAELRFAIAAELAHLRFGHTRVTRDELWQGARQRLSEALSLGLTLPGVSGWAAAWALRQQGLLRRAVPMFTHPTVLALLRRAGGAQQLEDSARRLVGAERPVQPSLSVRHAQLLAAHRVMTLTADRAGLVLCGDLRAALRAILLTDPDLAGELPVAERSGIDASVSRRGPGGALVYPDLAVRVAALLGFALSEERARLAQASALPGLPPVPDTVSGAPAP